MSLQSVPAIAFATLLALAPGAFAGGSGEDVLLIIDPSDPDSLRIGHHYREARGIPPSHVLYMDPGAADYASFLSQNLAALDGTLKRRGLEGLVDYIVIAPSERFFISAPGLVTDGCAPVTRIALASGYTLANQADVIAAGGLPSSTPNRYAQFSYTPLAFDSETAWFGGEPSTSASAKRYYIGALLGYTGERGNTAGELIDMIDRSVLSDGTHPVGTTYYMETTDIIRSGPRHGFYPSAVAAIMAGGGMAEHLFANLPLGQFDALGIMTGLANPNVDGANLALLPGSFADHLTSFAGTFDTASQTKMSRWIAKGASATSGTVQEPCNYAGKFPNARLHVESFAGLSLGEAWLRSMNFEPYQNLFYGDPLTRPFADFPVVDVPGLPTNPVSGNLTVTPVASATASGAAIAKLEFLVDGALCGTSGAGGSFDLDTEQLADGPHELRIVARDDSAIANAAAFQGTILVDNAGASLALGVAPLAGNLAERFDFSVTTLGHPGNFQHVRLLAGQRVIASGLAMTGVPLTLSVFGRNIGPGPVTLFAETNGARSAEITIDVSAIEGAPPGTPPVAFDYDIVLDPELPAVIALPAAFAESLDDVSFDVSFNGAAPILGGSGPYRILGTPPPDVFDVAFTLTYTVTTPAGTDTGFIGIGYERLPGYQGNNYCTGQLNSTGLGARMLFPNGAESIAANDTLLAAEQVPPNVFGLFFYGPTQIQVPFGDGFRCVGGTVFRLPPIPAEPNGLANFALDLTSPPQPAGQILPGSIWNFQFWYRDSAALASGFNLSDAKQTSFVP